MDKVIADVKTLAVAHPAATALVACATALGCILYVYAVLTLVSRFDTLQHNICSAVALSQKGNTVQYDFWIGAAQRAELRAQTEDERLAALDRDAAKNDRDIAAVFAPPKKPYSFPGC